MKCPGQETQYWNAEAIYEVDCPKCGHAVEFYKDDTTRICGSCGNRFVNPRLDFGCAAYCQFAEQCLGTLPEEFVGQQDNLLKDKVAVEMKRHYRTDFKSISLGMRTARHAEEIAKLAGGNIAVILCAAFLNGIGRSGGRLLGGAYSPEERLQTKAMAHAILERLAAKDAVIVSVCALLGGEAGEELEVEAGVLADAEAITRLEEMAKAGTLGVESATVLEEDRFRLDGGRQLARATLQRLQA